MAGGVEPLNGSAGVIVEDDGEMTADVVFVKVQDVEDLVADVETLGRRCACIVAALPSRDGVREAPPTADMIRYRPRPYRGDSVLIASRQGQLKELRSGVVLP